ncbi:MAG TPA: MFS transporter [Pirellulales bacterium]|nr:MFS transporter [Pirellulales bacterium]
MTNSSDDAPAAAPSPPRLPEELNPYRPPDDAPAAETPSSARLPRNVWLLGFTSLLNDTASEMIAPLMPQFIIEVLGGNKAYVGLIEGAADSISSVIKLFSGGWSDWVGRRKGLVVFGYAIAALSRPLLAFAAVPWHALAVRLGDRFGKGVRTAPRDAMIVDSTDKSIRGRAFGFHRAMDHVGAAIGPLLATVFLWWHSAGGSATGSTMSEHAVGVVTEHVGWDSQHLRLLFLLTLIPGLLVVALAALGLKEQPQHVPAGRRLDLSLRQYPRSFKVYLFALLIFTLGNSSDMFLLVRAKELGVDTRLLPMLWLVFHVAKSVGNVLGGRAVDRFGPRRLLLAGWLWYAVVYLAFAYATAAWQIWVLFLLYAVYYALAEPSEKTMVSHLVGSERAGLAYGWFNLLIGIGALPASLIFGLIYERVGGVAAFGLGAALALASMLVLLFVEERAGSWE